MRDALSLTDQAIAFGRGELKQADVVEMLGVVGRDEIAALMQALAAGSAPQLLALSAELAERNADFADVLGGMMEALHDFAVSQSIDGTSGPFLGDEVQLYYQIALVGLRDLPIAPDPRSGFEMTLLRMLAFTPERDGTVGGSVPPRTLSANRKHSRAATKHRRSQRKALSISAEPGTSPSGHVSRAGAQSSGSPAADEAPAAEEQAPAARRGKNLRSARPAAPHKYRQPSAGTRSWRS